VTVHEGNRARGLPTTQGQVLVLDPATGRLQGQLDGGMVTKLRTGAVAALATSVLALPDARTLAVIGTGEQAEGITEAILGLGNFRFEMVRVYSRDPGNRERFIRRMEARIRQCGFPTPGWHAATTAREALVDADVVVTATTASTPVVSAEAISAPCHINAVGAFRPDAAELAPELVGRARLVVVESRTAARREAGDLIQAADRGLLDWETVRELAEIAARPDDIRPAGGITVFKSVGVAALDAAVSRYILDKIVPGA
jgi:ornithine cyclodeaminase/alanine dehydrogenase-like protein (mu-crystallin family)